MKTLILPACSLGNTCQLAVDLLILNMSPMPAGQVSEPIPVAFIDCPFVEPVATNDALAVGKLHGQVHTAMEVFALDVGPNPSLFALQIRSTVVLGRSRDTARMIVDWAKNAGFERIIVLAGGLALEDTDRHAPRLVLGPRTTHVQGVRGVNTINCLAVDKEYDFTGMLRHILTSCEEVGLQGVGLLRLVFEGDNREDGQVLCRDVMTLVDAVPARGFGPGGKLEEPFSWRFANR